MEHKKALKKMLSGDERAGKRIADFCHEMALAYLEYKYNAENEILSKVGISKDELAWDCIAELFERDDNNQFVKFREYFCERDVDSMRSHQIEMQLRRLVFTKVNDGIFRNYGSIDPSLRKIIRNIKLAIKAIDGLQLDKVGNEKVVQLASTDQETQLPTVPPEFLEIRISERVDSSMQIPEIMEIVKTILDRQQIYQSSVSISQLAVSIRRVFARKLDIEDRKTTEPETNFLDDTVEQLISQCVEVQKSDFKSSYLEKDKLTKDTFNLYFKIVKTILLDEFVRDDPDADSYFEHAKKEMPDLSKQHYRQAHRQYVEYFVKNTRETLIEKLKKEHKYSAKSKNWND